MLMLNWISSACIVQAGQAGPLYVNTTISMVSTRQEHCCVCATETNKTLETSVVVAVVVTASVAAHFNLECFSTKSLEPEVSFFFFSHSSNWLSIDRNDSRLQLDSSDEFWLEIFWFSFSFWTRWNILREKMSLDFYISRRFDIWSDV